MSAATLLTLADGREIDLTEPHTADINWSVISEHLAKINRYSGATPGDTYSVAQHCVIGADQAFSDTGQRDLAAYFLIHDGHEAYLSDDTTPKKRALAEIASAHFGILAVNIMAAFDMMTERFDIAIHEAAGLAWPPTPQMAAAIKSYDLAMFVTEWRDLMRSIKHPNWEPYRKIAPLADTIVPVGWMNAKAMLLDRCRRYLPCFEKRDVAE